LIINYNDMAYETKQQHSAAYGECASAIADANTRAIALRRVAPLPARQSEPCRQNTRRSGAMTCNSYPAGIS